MSSITFEQTPQPFRLVLSIERLRERLLWLTGLSGAFVFIQPGPYEFVSLFTLLFFSVTGLRLRAVLMPFVLLLVVYNIGFTISVLPVLDAQTELWVATSWYMAVTAIGFAALLDINTEVRLDCLLRGYMAGAVIAALAGVVGYFHAVPQPVSELFLKYGRARGTFNDPNVLGAFLVLPSLLSLQRLLQPGFSNKVGAALRIVLFATAIFLSFSRGAWMQFAGTMPLLLLLISLTSRSGAERLRVLLIALAGAAAIMMLLAVLVSIDSVHELFKERAVVEEAYDAGPLGRFGRYSLGALLVLDRPLGIGPMQFANLFVEDPHDAYLDAFVSGGWISGFCFTALMLASLVLGVRSAFLDAPWQRTYLAIYAAGVGTILEGIIIDTNHWRHFFLLLGALWGLMVATRVARAERDRPIGSEIRNSRPALARCRSVTGVRRLA